MKTDGLDAMKSKRPTSRTLLRVFLLLGGGLSFGYGLWAEVTRFIGLGALAAVLGGGGLVHRRWERHKPEEPDSEAKG
ncbi:MAG: hypothetical protein U5K70_05720 [Halodesulfurarchaeum sp.]|nr:hypothetical protein [Halodesulfurarchaeum sp.]